MSPNFMQKGTFWGPVLTSFREKIISVKNPAVTFL